MGNLHTNEAMLCFSLFSCFVDIKGQHQTTHELKTDQSKQTGTFWGGRL